MDPGQARQDLIRFLKTVARPDQRVDGIADHTNLIDAGLIDSFAMIQIILYLEQQHGLNLRNAGVEVSELASIAGILGAIERS